MLSESEREETQGITVEIAIMGGLGYAWLKTHYDHVTHFCRYLTAFALLFVFQ